MENLTINDVESKIILLRNQQVILDCDVAQLYGVETKRVNEAVSNNPEKFPEGYVFCLDENENKFLRSKISTIKNKGRGEHSKYLPKAFTEKGLYMLATILKSPQAVQTTIAIVETYAKLRELTNTMSVISSSEDQSQQRSLLQQCGKILDDIISNNLPAKSTETSFELNLAMFKLKHSVKRENEEEINRLKEQIDLLNKGLDKKGSISSNN